MTTDPRQHGIGATWFLPVRSGDPVLIDLPGVNLDFAVVARDGLNRLDASWDAPGAYLLLDPVNSEDRAAVYVGKAPGGLRTRLRQHVRVREEWRRALLIRRPYQGFNSAEVGWLEGRLYDLLAAAKNIHLNNGNRPSDETLLAWQRAQLEGVLPHVLSVLRALGLDPDSGTEPVDADLSAVLETSRSDVSPIYLTGGEPARGSSATSPVEATQPSRHATVARNKIEIFDLLRASLLSVGDVLSVTFKKVDYFVTVQHNGSLALQGKTYPSPTAAARAVTGGSVNGWKFWRAPTGQKIDDLRTHYLDMR